MSRRADIDGRDEPARGDDGHAELLSTFESHDLVLGMGLVEASAADAFDPEVPLAGLSPSASRPSPRRGACT